MSKWRSRASNTFDTSCHHFDTNVASCLPAGSPKLLPGTPKPNVSYPHHPHPPSLPNNNRQTLPPPWTLSFAPRALSHDCKHKKKTYRSLTMPGFDFSNYDRNQALIARGLPPPKATSTGTTIVGCLFDGGVVVRLYPLSPSPPGGGGERDTRSFKKKH